MHRCGQPTGLVFFLWVAGFFPPTFFPAGVSSVAGFRSVVDGFPVWRWRLSVVGLVEVWLSPCAVFPPKLQAPVSILAVFHAAFSWGSMAVAFLGM